VAVLAVAAAYLLLLRHDGWTVLAAGLLAFSSISLVATGFLPCDAGCVDVSTTSSLHSLTSTTSAIGLPLAAIVSTVVFRRSRWFGSGWQVFSFRAGLISLATGLIVGIGLLDATLGLAQRAAMGLGLLWLLIVSTKLHSVAANRAVGDRVAGYATS
jgi:uncharacterized protein DUF998